MSSTDSSMRIGAKSVHRLSSPFGRQKVKVDLHA